jgi:hypothetical protein
VVGIAEKNLNAEFFENVLRHAFDSGSCAHRHKDRSFDLAVRQSQTTGAGGTAASFNLKSK